MVRIALSPSTASAPPPVAAENYSAVPPILAKNFHLSIRFSPNDAQLLASNFPEFDNRNF
jgi:hypothetical protein